MGFGARESRVLKWALPPTSRGSVGKSHQPSNPVSSSVEGERTSFWGVLGLKGGSPHKQSGAVLDADRYSILICSVPSYIGSFAIIITPKGYGKEIVFMHSRPKQDYTPLNICIFFPHA